MDECWSDLDEPMDSLGAPGSPSITSRLSIQKIYSVVSRFYIFKQTLVKEIGFGGALEIKPWQKLNLKLSAWLLDRVDVESCTLNTEGQPPIGIFDQDAEKVFSIPCGKTTIGAEGVEPSNACLEYTRFTSNFSDKGIHSLKAAEAYLIREFSEDSTAVEIECFKIAFIIFFVGHILAPSAKHDYITIDFWCALKDVSRIKEWNLCGYVLKHLFIAARKFKADVAKRNNTIHIIGNHLFLQIMLFDMLDHGVIPVESDQVPRIALYDYETTKKIVDMIPVSLGGDVSFHGGKFKESTEVTDGRVAQVNNDKGQRKLTMMCSPMLRASYSRTGANDFAGEKLGILLREHNAKTLTGISEIRINSQFGMFGFVDKLMACIAENCTCCKTAGRRHCVLKVKDPAPELLVSGNPYRTPVAEKNAPRSNFGREQEESSGASSPLKRQFFATSSGGVSSASSKQRRIQVAQPQFDASTNGTRISFSRTDATKPLTPLAAKIIQFMDDVASTCVSYPEEHLELPAPSLSPGLHT